LHCVSVLICHGFMLAVTDFVQTTRHVARKIIKGAPFRIVSRRGLTRNGGKCRGE